MANEDEVSKPGQKQPEDERKFSQEQFDLLKRCSDKKDITEWNEWRKKQPHEKIWLQRAELYHAHLENAYLNGAHLENAYLNDAHLENAYLNVAHLKDADLSNAHLINAKLNSAHLENAYMSGAHLENACLWGSYLDNVNLMEANLENSILGCAHLENAKLNSSDLENAYMRAAHLENADLRYANLEDADLRYANLEHAKLMETNLRGARFWDTKLQGADFSRAIVDGETLFSEYCEVDRHTKFEAVALGNLRIYSRMKQLLEYNIRRMNWKVWYKDHFLLQWPVKLFWSFSDYGISTWRIIGWFFLLALAFAAIYANCACWCPPGIVNNLDVEPEINQQVSLLDYIDYGLEVFFRPIYFSIVTMTTLGFGDIYARKGSWIGHILLTFQVILGYVLLGALVTRFAVLFTAGGPAGKFSTTKTKEKGKDKK